MSIDPARRRFTVSIAIGCAWLVALRLTMSRTANAATDDNIDALSHRAGAVTAGKSISTGRVTIDTPRLADNGHSVPITIRVDCAMTAQEFVRILCWSPKAIRAQSLPRFISTQNPAVQRSPPASDSTKRSEIGRAHV